MNKYPNPITGEMHALSLTDPEPGIYAGVSHSDYLAIDAVSRSKIKDFDEAREKLVYPSDEPKDHFTFGTQYHAYVFESHQFYDGTYIEGQVTETGKRGKDFRAQQDEHGHDKVYKPQDLEAYEDMYEALKRYRKSYAVLASDNLRELTVIFRHEQSNLICKIKIDILIMKSGWIIDLKTARDVTRDKFRWAIRDYRYDLQAGFYVMGCEATEGLTHVQNFGIVAQEKKPPYIVRGHDMAEHIADGIVESNRLLCEYADWKNEGCPMPDGLEVMEKYSLK